MYHKEETNTKEKEINTVCSRYEMRKINLLYLYNSFKE